jgi:cytochrome P450
MVAHGTAQPDATTRPLQKMSIAHSLGFWLRVALPTWMKGIIVRRPAAVALAERLDFDAKAVRYMERLHAAYEGRSVLVRNPFRPQAVVLDQDDAWIVLAETPEPFSPASDEKRAALAHFEPANSLVSHGAERAPKRFLNEQVLETAEPVHSHADHFRIVVREEMEQLLDEAWRTGELTWPIFSKAWFRMIRRVVLGDSAKDDHGITGLMVQLRRRANWAFMVPKNRRAREDLHERLLAYVERAEPGSLSALLAGAASSRAPTHQMTQWLFAFDPAGMTTFRALAVILSDADALARAQSEISRDRSDLSFLRACVVETLRLFPTTPAILRQTTAPAQLKSGVVPEGAGVVIFTPFFQRDSRLVGADRFRPESWTGVDPEERPPFAPFSRGPAACPAKNLVPLLVSEALRHLLAAEAFLLVAPRWLKMNADFRGTLNNYDIKFKAVRKSRR